MFAAAILWPPLASLAGWRSGLALWHQDQLQIAAVVLSVSGCVIALGSQAYMGRSWRIGAARGKLGPFVAAGPFGGSRNPVFAGQAILFLGLFLANPDIVLGAVLFALAMAIWLQVQQEERELEATFGEDYLYYKRKVRRWF